MLREEIRILVVDDVNAMRVQIRDLLKSLGYKKVTLASNGAEAKTFLEKEGVELVLADWQMQPIDGLELLKFVRSSPAHAKTAFILVTAETTKERVVEAVQAGVDQYLVKPVTEDEIRIKVDGTLLKKEIL